MASETISIDEVIDGLGGTAKVARYCRVSMAAVSNWRAAGFVPDRHHFRLDRLAKKLAFTIPVEFFDDNADAA